MTDHAPPGVPALAASALALAAGISFQSSCSTDVGRLLRVLAASVVSGSIGEVGTGAGVGTAWLAAGMGPRAALISIEQDAGRVAAVRRLFAGDTRVTVVHGDWRDLLARGPFALLFVDAADAKAGGAGDALGALAPGGVAVLDDLTPKELWAGEWRGRRDPVRDFWLNDPRLAATELLVSPREAVIVAARVG